MTSTRVPVPAISGTCSRWTTGTLTWVGAVPAAWPPEGVIHRLVLWNIDLTLVDVARVSRPAYAEAFEAVAGRPLVRLPQMAGRSESEIFFDALAFHGV